MNQTTAYVDVLDAAFHKFCNSLSPELKSRMNGRLERGLQIALSGGVAPASPESISQFRVNSSDPAKPPYLVDLNARTCTCPDHWKGHYCKHRVAAQVFKMANQALQPQEAKSASQQLDARSDGQAVIWACVRLDGKNIGVEVLGIENDLVRVQALPAVKDDGKLEPQFPFPDGNCSQLVQASDLVHIRIFHYA